MVYYQNQYKLYAVGVHQALLASRMPPAWMHVVKVSFPRTITEPYTLQYEKFLFGQILARMALGIHPEDQLPALKSQIGRSGNKVDGHEYHALKEAKGLPCRNNLLRIVTLRFLLKDPQQRPHYELVMLWPSAWTDARYLLFMVRFFERINAFSNKKAVFGWCSRYQEEVIPGGWFSSQKIGPTALKMFSKEIFRNDKKFKDYIAALPYLFEMTEKEMEMVRQHVEEKGLFGVFWQLEAHAFEMTGIFTVTGSLSVGFINFWRDKFPLLISAAYLISINLCLHDEESFKEFFPGPAKYYEQFKNRSCSGHQI